MKTWLRLLALVLHLISFGIWIPALFLPLITMKFGMQESGLLSLFANAVSQEKTLSIWGTVTELANENHKMLAFLIFFFAIVVPVTKTLLLSLGLIFPGKPLGQKSSRIVFYIGKWAMADVFVVGITIALMTVKSHVMVQAEARSGLYVFAAYVILSTLAAQLSVLAARVQESGSQASL